ncbi:hypothetical protein H920_20073 [Fukomys damarensis]|uniref:Uncharacterized protein n=1 Tax=Fukomys damarensis TaxID=885580 RepID=A0A091CN78_FUKDA|nr:hypothetical protein H920_20073 [Fukomys damarensis]
MLSHYPTSGSHRRLLALLKETSTTDDNTKDYQCQKESAARAGNTDNRKQQRMAGSGRELKESPSPVSGRVPKSCWWLLAPSGEEGH